MAELSILELVVGAKINFENVVSMNPGLGRHPIFIIAMDQLKEAIDELEKQALKGH